MMKVSDYLNMLIQHESVVGDLYSIFAKTYPDHGSFWQSIAQEELEHSELLKQLTNHIKQGLARFNPEKFRPIAIKESINYIQEQALRAKKAKLPLKNALSIAMDIERRIIDGKIFDAFQGYSVESRQIIRKLGTAVTDHFRRLEQVWKEYRYA